MTERRTHRSRAYAIRKGWISGGAVVEIGDTASLGYLVVGNRGKR